MSRYLNLFRTRAMNGISTPELVVKIINNMFAKDDNEENLNFIKAFLGNRRGSDIVVAWGYGKEKEYKAQVEAVEKLLEDFNKYKIIVKEEVIKEIQNLDRHPAPTSWAVFNGFEHSAELAKY